MNTQQKEITKLNNGNLLEPTNELKINHIDQDD